MKGQMKRLWRAEFHAPDRDRVDMVVDSEKSSMRIEIRQEMSVDFINRRQLRKARRTTVCGGGGDEEDEEVTVR